MDATACSAARSPATRRTGPGCSSARAPSAASTPRTVAVPDVAAWCCANAAGWQDVLGPARRPRERPQPDVWSPLEYACHVRDVFRLYDERLGLMLDEDEPHFANWDQDETAVAERYDEQDPADRRRRARRPRPSRRRRFAAVDGEQWAPHGRRSDGARFTVDTFARYFIHDPVHHLHDVR